MGANYGCCYCGGGEGGGACGCSVMVLVVVVVTEDKEMVLVVQEVEAAMRRTIKSCLHFLCHCLPARNAGVTSILFFSNIMTNTHTTLSLYFRFKADF